MKYIDNNELTEILKSRKRMYVFGAGLDASRLCNEEYIYKHVIAFIDNWKNKNDIFIGRKIISIDEVNLEDDEFILITSMKYASEIESQLIQLGFEAEINYYIWDDLFRYHKNEDIDKYIVKLKSIWNKTRTTGDNEILIPIKSGCDGFSYVYAYFANYFAYKYDAKIMGYIFNDEQILTDVYRDIYKAINVDDFINSNNYYSDEVISNFENIWNRIESWDDVKNIELYGINFGTSIIRLFLRAYVPTFEIKTDVFHKFLLSKVSLILFWKNYFENHKVKIVILTDATICDPIIRDLAISMKIKVYGIEADKIRKVCMDYHDDSVSMNFKKMWDELDDVEKKVALEWAQNKINSRILGSADELPVWDRVNFSFAEKIQSNRFLEKNNKVKILICPHIFEEDCYRCGEQIFSNNYFEWLTHLGELSNKYTNYDWYLKKHPTSSKRDLLIIDKIVEKYKNIKLLPDKISPLQLKEEGINYALTVYGSIGHEYPVIGIQVINAGNNPHINFDFNWNPKTREEYDLLIENLEDLDPKNDMNGLYAYYAMNYLIYDWNRLGFKNLFFEKEYLGLNNNSLFMVGIKPGTWIFNEILEEWNEKRHKEIIQALPDIIQDADNWEPTKLYKRKEFVDMVNRYLYE